MSPINAYLIKMMTDQQQRDLEAMTAENRRISLARQESAAALVAGRVPALAAAYGDDCPSRRPCPPILLGRTRFSGSPRRPEVTSTTSMAFPSVPPKHCPRGGATFAVEGR